MEKSFLNTDVSNLEKLLKLSYIEYQNIRDRIAGKRTNRSNMGRFV